MITIIPATDADLPIIQDIAHQTWPSTFKDILSPTQIDYMLNMMYDPNSLNKQVNEKGHVFLLAKATTNGEYLGFTSYELNYQGQPITKVHKIYLLPASQGKGVGRLLIDAVANAATEHQNNQLSLNVNRFNKAIQFYERMGFVIVKTEDIDIGDGFLMEDFVMEKSLN